MLTVHRANNAQAEILGKLDRLLSVQQELQTTIKRAAPSLFHNIEAERISSDHSPEKHVRAGTATNIDLCSPMIGSVMLESAAAPLQAQSDGRPRKHGRSNSNETSIPADHTTRWVGILEWPAVRRITEPFIPVHGFWPDPLQQETTDGEIRCDEHSDNLEPGNRPTPSLQQWNSFGLSTANVPATDYDDRHQQQRFTEAAMSRLSEKFLSRFGVMHPVISRQQLEPLMAEFRDVAIDATRFVTSFVTRDDEMMPRHVFMPCWSAEQSIHVALVLLVLALGDICQHMEEEDASVVPTQQRDTTSKTPDPGFSCFTAAATLISHNHRQWKHLLCENVQANILAGLYEAQFSRILESHAYYAKASHLLYLALKP